MKSVKSSTTPNKPVILFPQGKRIAPVSSVFIKIQRKKYMLSFDGKLNPCRLIEKATSHMEMWVFWDMDPDWIDPLNLNLFLLVRLWILLMCSIGPKEKIEGQPGARVLFEAVEGEECRHLQRIRLDLRKFGVRLCLSRYLGLLYTKKYLSKS